MSFTFDCEANAVYLDLAPDSDEARLKQVVLEGHPFEAELIVDVDSTGKIIGIEIIGATAVLHQEILSIATHIGP